MKVIKSYRIAFGASVAFVTRWVLVEILEDDQNAPPWVRFNGSGHGGVRESWYSDPRDGEVLLGASDGPGRRAYYFYDKAGALKTAEEEGWDAPPYGQCDRAKTAVAHDFQYLRGWLLGEWTYVGVRCTILGSDDTPIRGGGPTSDSLWGVETYGDYHLVIANEMADELAKSYEEREADRGRMVPMTNEEYVNNGGLQCPRCRSYKIEAGSIWSEAGDAWCEVSCNSCGYRYQDTYKLVGYTTEFSDNA